MTRDERRREVRFLSRRYWGRAYLCYVACLPCAYLHLSFDMKTAGAIAMLAGVALPLLNFHRQVRRFDRMNPVDEEETEHTPSRWEKARKAWKEFFTYHPPFYTIAEWEAMHGRRPGEILGSNGPSRPHGPVGPPPKTGKVVRPEPITTQPFGRPAMVVPEHVSWSRYVLDLPSGLTPEEEVAWSNKFYKQFYETMLSERESKAQYLASQSLVARRGV